MHSILNMLDFKKIIYFLTINHFSMKTPNQKHISITEN